MKKRLIPIVYHTDFELEGRLQACAGLFPYGNESYYGGDVASPDHKSVEAFVCSACVEGLTKWLQTQEQSSDGGTE